MEAVKDGFEACACERWGLWAGENVAELYCIGRNSWLTLYRAPEGMSPRDVRRLLNGLESGCVVIVSVHGDLVDVMAQSCLDVEPVVAHDIPWRSEDFWALGANGEGALFSFELDRQFGRKRMEQAFVSDFRVHCRRLSESWKGEIGDEDRASLSVTTLLRLLFVAFLVSRGTMDGRRNFLHEEAHACLCEGKSVYREMIRPLFFETLNREESERSPRALAFGSIPFLNGGLFTPSDLERRYEELDAPNAVWIEIIGTLFSKYPFCLESDAGNGLDPWMLGHIFESLMSPQRRAGTGSFYTPVGLARLIVRRTFEHWLMGRPGVSAEIAHWLCSLEDSGAPGVELPLEVCRAVDDALHEITVLDPAAGSGVFLQCTLEMLHALHMKLKTLLGEAVHPGLLAKQILVENLYGVDILYQANQLCELRLWLELVRYYPPEGPLPPLPNLDLNIQCGDSLLDLRQFGAFLGIGVQPDVEYGVLKRRYVLSTGMVKRRLSARLRELSSRAGAGLLRRIEEGYAREMASVGVESRDLFTRVPSLSAVQKARLSAIQAQRHFIARWRDEETPLFSFDVHYGEVLARGGFDIVLGNPPWFSLHTVPREVQAALKSLYRTAITTSGKGSQSCDISALFVEKALLCVRRDGLVSMVLPNKLFSAPSYESFRRYISHHSVCIEKSDWSDTPHNAFGAATYPASLILRRSDCVKFFSALGGDALRREIALTSGDVCEVLPGFPRLGRCFVVKRGLCTGANAHFIGHEVEEGGTGLVRSVCFDTGDGPEVVEIEREVLHPVLRGTHVRAYRNPMGLGHRERILFTHDWCVPSRPLAHLPERAEGWLQRCRGALERRKGLGRRPYYSLFGCGEHQRWMKVVWRDISQELEACFVGEREALPLNTVYYIPVRTAEDGYLLVAWLNSRFVRAHCRARAEHARNGYRRYFAWVVEELPWIFEDSRCRPYVPELVELSRHCHEARECGSYCDAIDALVEACVELVSQDRQVWVR